MRSAIVLFVAVAACGGSESSSPDAAMQSNDASTDAAVDAAIDAPPDPCEGVTCECTAATESTDCAAHEYCNATSTSRTCECVAGYSDTVNGCVWTGSIVDPGFTSSTAWQASNGAVVNTSAAGNVDPGEAQYTPATLCALGLVKQTATMPAFAKAQPLVLSLTYKNQIDLVQFDRVLMGVSFGDNWSPLPNYNDANFHTVRVCVPEGGFAPTGTAGAGAPVTFAFGPFAKPERCPNSMITSFAVDHAEIVVATPGECGTVFGKHVNYDAESTGGWTFTTTGTSSGGFVAGVGANGTKAAQLKLGQRCDAARMETNVNVPMVANPALDLFVAVNAGANATMTFGSGLFQMSVSQGSLPASAQATTLHMCIPPALRGQTLSLMFSMSGGGGFCNDVLNHTVSVDNVQVVDDPSCAADASLTNAGFELDERVFGASGFVSSTTSQAFVRSTANEAHGGTRFLALESLGRCSTTTYNMLPIVPASIVGAGPALKFFAKVGTNPDASTLVRRQGLPSTTLTEGGGYMPYTVCLDPVYAGRAQAVTISHNGGSGLCDNSNYTMQSAFIDDVTVTTDPSCPAQ